MQNASDRQFGGVIVFIIVGLVLAGLLGGAIYASKQQGRIASQTGTVATNDQKTDNTSTEAPQNDTANNTTNEDKGSSTTTDAPSSSSTSDSQTTTTPGRGAGEPVPATGPTHIASTGPEDAIVPGLGLAMLAAGFVSYHRSHRAIRTRALRQ